MQEPKTKNEPTKNGLYLDQIENAVFSVAKNMYLEFRGWAERAGRQLEERGDWPETNGLFGETYMNLVDFVEGSKKILGERHGYQQLLCHLGNRRDGFAPQIGKVNEYTKQGISGDESRKVVRELLEWSKKGLELTGYREFEHDYDACGC